MVIKRAEAEIEKTIEQVIQLGQHPAISKPVDAYAKHKYSTPLFVLRETFAAFQQHNGLNLSASLSFYAMFALIPMALLMFFLLSHLVISSNYAIVKLAIITSELLPKFSHRIMIEVYNVSQHEAAWGVFGFLALLWIITPMAGSLRAAFHTILSVIEPPSFIRKKFKDMVAVVGILMMFFIFSFFGLMLEKVMHVTDWSPWVSKVIDHGSSILLSGALIAVFYRIFFPTKVALRHILTGSLITAILWIAMRPLFGLFLSLNQSYGEVFGGMKNMFISIGWLYYTFAVFLFGTELIATLHRHDMLLLRGLFRPMRYNKAHYMETLMKRYGKTYQQNDVLYHANEVGNAVFFIVQGQVRLTLDGITLREMQTGDYFGEIGALSEHARYADAVVISDSADILTIEADVLESLIKGDPDIAMKFLREMAVQLREQSTASRSSLPHTAQ